MNQAAVANAAGSAQLLSRLQGKNRLMVESQVLPAGFVPERRYYPFSHFLRHKFGTRVQRVTIDGGFTCPNVDGTVTTGGCVYCDNRSFSPNRRLPRTTLRAQIDRGIAILSRRFRT